MARKGTIENHPDRALIEQAIIEGKSDLEVSKNFDGISEQAVFRYRKNKMPEMLRHAQLESVDGIIRRIAEYTESIDELFRNIKLWLEDPKHPGKMDFSPHASEVIVTYEYTNEAGRRMTGKANLQDLLDKLDVNYKPIRLSLGITDPRITMLKTAEVLNKQLELLAKAKGAINESATTTININTGSIDEIISIARKALEPYPEASQAFVEALLGNIEDNDDQQKV